MNLAQALRGAAVSTLRGLVGETGGILSPGEIQTLAANAGFAGAELATAVAIALAESVPSGNPNSYNPEVNAQGGTPQGQGSYGLWQIYLKKHPEFAGWNLYDPQTNANAAFRVFQREGFHAWSTFKSGLYRAYLGMVPGAVVPGAQSADSPQAPLTIDASTGLPIEDSTPTPSRAPNQILGLTLLAVGAYLAADYFLGD